jgi:hypothetical protein
MKIEMIKIDNLSEQRTETNGKKTEKQGTKQISKGKKTVFNLLSRKLTESDYLLISKGSSFCPKLS